MAQEEEQIITVSAGPCTNLTFYGCSL